MNYYRKYKKVILNEPQKNKILYLYQLIFYILLMSLIFFNSLSLLCNYNSHIYNIALFIAILSVIYLSYVLFIRCKIDISNKNFFKSKDLVICNAKVLFINKRKKTIVYAIYGDISDNGLQNAYIYPVSNKELKSINVGDNLLVFETLIVKTFDIRLVYGADINQCFFHEENAYVGKLNLLPHPNAKTIDPVERSLTIEERTKYQLKDLISIQPVIIFAPAISYKMKHKIIGTTYSRAKYISYFRWINNQYQLISTACDISGINYGDILLRFTVKDRSKIYLYSIKRKAFYSGLELDEKMFKK